MMESRLCLYDNSLKLIEQSIPISKIRELHFFEEYVKLKFNIGNDESELQKFNEFNKKIKSKLRALEEEYKPYM